MRNLFWVGCILAIAVSVGACGAAPTSTPGPSALGFGPAPWQDGATASYEWLDQSGTQIGTAEFGFSLSTGVWTITDKDAISGLDQTLEMQIDAATLAPLGETKSIHTANSDVQLTTQYQNGTLSIQAVVDGQNKTASLDVPANAVDNDQLLMTLRALPFAQGTMATYVVIVAQNALKVDTTVTVQGQEMITVPAGDFECWRVEIAAGQTKQKAWYQVAAPNMLIQYDNGTTRMVLARSEG
jgi:hypothetical protein